MKHVARLALIVAILSCSPEKRSDVPPEIATLAIDALRAATEIKVSGDANAVLREHVLSPRYAAAMAKHFALMRELHRVGLASRIRYPRSSVSVEHNQFCEKGRVAHLVVTAMVRYDMEALPPAGGSPPPYTAGQEEHVFRFERRDDGTWVIAKHHEITLGEMHQTDVVRRLRNPCRGAWPPQVRTRGGRRLPATILRMQTYELTVVIERDEDGRYLAVCPALQGCYTEGDSEEEARTLIADAIRLHIESRLERGEPIPDEVSTERITVSV